MSHNAPLPPLKRKQIGLFSTLTMPLNERANLRNRSIAYYYPNYAVHFLDPTCNIIISGGNNRLRSRILCQQIELAQAVGLPVIILHEGNTELLNQISGAFSAAPEYSEISKRSPRFEPIFDLTDSEITDQIWQVTPQGYALKPEGRYCIDAAIAYLRACNRAVSIRNLQTSQQVDMVNLVNQANGQGILSDAAAQSIITRLTYGQSERMKMDLIISDYIRELDPILLKKGGGLQPENLLSAVRHKKILICDVVSVGSEFLFNTVIYQLRRIMACGIRCMLVLDSLAVQSNQKFSEILKLASQNVHLTISSDDLYAQVGGEEKLFQALVGKSQINFVLRHTSAGSAKKWAEALGEYDAWIMSTNTNYGHQTSPYTLMGTYSSNYGTSTQRMREFIVKPEYISSMTESECYILQAGRGISHIQLL